MVMIGYALPKALANFCRRSRSVGFGGPSEGIRPSPRRMSRSTSDWSSTPRRAITLNNTASALLICTGEYQQTEGDGDESHGFVVCEVRQGHPAGVRYRKAVD